MFYGSSSYAYCMFHTQPTVLTLLIGLHQVGVDKDSTLQFPLKSILSENQNPVLLFSQLFLHLFSNVLRVISCARFLISGNPLPSLVMPRRSTAGRASSST